MEVARSAGYTEDMPLVHLKPAQYLVFAQKAIGRLHWLMITLNESTLICQSPGNSNSGGEIVTITISRKKATLHSRPVNGYYWDEIQSRNNTALVKETIAALIEEQDKADRNLHPMHREKYGALIPSRSYIVTPVIVYINVLVFIAMAIAGISPLHPTAQSLFLWGGNFRSAVTHGEWWRLFTYMFLHGGALHLLMNTFALLYIGMFLEPLLGRFRFISAYVLTGVCAGLLSITVHDSSIGVGASGAIFGMYGVFLAMLTTSHIQKTMRKTMRRSILFFVVYNLMYGLQGNTDNAAHIGGLVSGLIIGFIYYRGIARHTSFSRQLITTAMIAKFVIALTALSIHSKLL